MAVIAGDASWPSILLARAGTPDAATDIEAAEASGAWTAWRQAAGTLAPEQVIKLVRNAGLRGRGGSGYPTGDKWAACAAERGRTRHVVANGFEADPGAQADRTLMETDPHAVVEGVALAAWAVRAHDAIIAVDARATVAIERLRAAVSAAEAKGYLGDRAMGTGSPLRIEVRPLSGSFVLGEETVLLRALEDRRAQPDQRPPYPYARGLWGEPTVVNNVETLAAVPWIVANGAGAYAAIGATDEPGTTLVQLSGAVKQPGVAEVPMGTTLREIIDKAGGGATGSLKAVLVGGPTGGFLPADALDTPLGHAELDAAGAILGSGTVLVIDDTTCIVDLAALLTRFDGDEACGKTIPCRIGTRRLAELGAAFCTGRARPTDAALVASLSDDIRDGALCGLERTAVNPLRSGMRYFAQEFEDHIVRGTCPAGVCQPIRVAAVAHR
ncbi:MAG: NADH-ubiquinone oxidoreductase-F iron-sulfur binding region domain-containing protein [Candidatus Limnocylindrales bacterium]